MNKTNFVAKEFRVLVICILLVIYIHVSAEKAGFISHYLQWPHYNFTWSMILNSIFDISFPCITRPHQPRKFIISKSAKKATKITLKYMQLCLLQKENRLLIN